MPVCRPPLTIGTTVTVADLALPAGVTTDVPDDAPIVVGSATRFTTLIDHGIDAASADDIIDGELAEGQGGGDAGEGEGGEAAEAEGDAEG